MSMSLPNLLIRFSQLTLLMLKILNPYMFEILSNIKLVWIIKKRTLLLGPLFKTRHSRIEGAAPLSKTLVGKGVTTTKLSIIFSEWNVSHIQNDTLACGRVKSRPKYINNGRRWHWTKSMKDSSNSTLRVHSIPIPILINPKSLHKVDRQRTVCRNSRTVIVKKWSNKSLR